MSVRRATWSWAHIGERVDRYAGTVEHIFLPFCINDRQVCRGLSYGLKIFIEMFRRRWKRSKLASQNIVIKVCGPRARI
ncbi:hypothetical protein CANTEDRAFT_112628 [Yamadazyma tenuis ATCC 10573]|uniref:Uncharacterized protein n=1 Tax=Candida tenuis (strain ATCC 10573 / BCRC 21748 / CBS 615 / JCM 9827 / NBRC 10315 / NRRL Y-1498 / VKM Y-70) TaxID=590646 RepID=G3AY41_CANTC|nr:uncharacterized protein CANTEDRAFT_112628 [Yamadazyma tenuis ATCC 10573]EGV65763.1 hypothetical protein CANTEDRAFT_112628 [Yamadazyma tenuis ATCC 10573]